MCRYLPHPKIRQREVIPMVVTVLISLIGGFIGSLAANYVYDKFTKR